MENEISVLIVEDEEVWIQNLQRLLSDFGYKVAGIATTVDEALAAFNTISYDLILMDINIDGHNSGLELGKIVNRLYQKPFIFITANNAHQTEEAAAANPSAYLTKPVNPASLFIAIQNAINNFSNNKAATSTASDDALSSFFVKQGSRYKKVDWKDVAYIAAGKNYIGLFNAADKTEYYIRSSLQKILTHQVPKALQKQFIQVNRGEAVQLNFIQDLSNDEVRTAYKSFAVSEGYAKELREKLNII